MGSIQAGAEKRPRVLVADDDPKSRFALVERATRMELEAEGAEDGVQAMEALHLEEYDVLVIEQLLPGMPAKDVIRDARRLHPDLQVIVLASNPNLDMAVEALRAGANEFLLKPLKSLEELEAALCRLLEDNAYRKERTHMLETMQRLAVTDPLTGLFNRRRLADALEMEIDRARRYRRALSMVMIDLDNLKHINDAHGHQAGDQALRDVAEAILASARKSDLVTRYGGDEFLILLPEADLKAAVRVAKRICERIGRLSSAEMELSASAGVIQWEADCHTPEAFIRAVDKVLYEAKASGRSSLRFGTPNREAKIHQEISQEE